MNHHQRHTPPGANRAWRYRALTLLAIMASQGTTVAALHLKTKRDFPGKNPGYLAVVGAPTLRFQDPMATTVVASLARSPSSEPGSLAHASEKPPTVNSAVVSTPIEPAMRDPETPPASTENSNPTKTKSSPQILPDDTRPNPRPEEFLPFFQFPGGKTQSGVRLVVPVPRESTSSPALPVSSANYSQTPK